MLSSNSNSDEYESFSSSSESIAEEENDIPAENEFDPSGSDDDDLEEVYVDEPLADEEWLDEYNRSQNEAKEKLEQLAKRMDGTESTDSW